MSQKEEENIFLLATKDAKNAKQRKLLEKTARHRSEVALLRQNSEGRRHMP